MFFNVEQFFKDNKLDLEILYLEEIIEKLNEAKNYFKNKELNIQEKNLLNKVETAYDKNMFKLFQILKENNIPKEKIKIKMENCNINDWFLNFNDGKKEEKEQILKKDISDKKNKMYLYYKNFLINYLLNINTLPSFFFWFFSFLLWW